MADAGGVAEVGGPALVGRDGELATIGRALGTPPAVVLVEGEAGVGKTRLLTEALAAQEAAGRRTLLATCPPYRRPHTLGPLVDGVRRVVADAGDLAGLGLSPLAGALRPVLPEWAEVLPAPLEALEDATAARHRLFRALAELLDRLGVAVLAVEDAYWADEATQEFLLFLTSRPGQSVSVLCSYRPEDVRGGSPVGRLAARVPAGGARLRIELRPLDVAGTAELVSSMLAHGPISDGFARFLHRGTDGIPLALEESIRLLADRGDLVRRDGEWVRRGLDQLVVPLTVRDAVLERVDRLSADAGAVLNAAALLADPVAEPTLAAVCELPADRVRAGLTEALAARLLTTDRRGQVSYRHVLAARAVYHAIPAPVRRDLHRREAGDQDRWRSYADRAAADAMAVGDEATAVALLHDLLVHADLPAPDVVALLERLPVAAMSSERVPELVAALRRVVESGALPTADAARLRFQIATLLEVVSEFDAAQSELERVVPDLAPGSLTAVRAMLLLGWTRGSARAGSAHLGWLRRAAGAIPGLSDEERLEVLGQLAVGLLQLGDEEGWAVADRIPDATDTVRARHAVVLRGVNAGDMAMHWGRQRLAHRYLDEAARLVEAHGYRRLDATLRATQAHLDWYEGRWEGLADRADALSELDPRPSTRLEALLVSGMCRLAAGDAASAARLDVALAEQRARGDVNMVMEPAAVLGRLRLDATDPAGALALTDEPAAMLAHKGLWLWGTELVPVRVAALRALGRDAAAAALAADFEAGLPGSAPAPRAAVRLCRALLAGDPAEQAALFESAAAAWDALPRPYHGWLARERQGAALLAAGRRADGLAVLRRTVDGLTALGARAAAARAAALLRRHGVGAGRPSFGDRLSPRELEVARLVAEGLTNPEIAERLFLSRATVAQHVNAARRKLRAATRTALAVRLVEEGLAAGGR